jgi:hypothetical protein
MPWELCILKYEGAPPRFRAHTSESRELPLGSLEEVRQHIDRVFPGTVWEEEPSLIEVMKLTGNKSWEKWDAKMIEASSYPTLKGLYERGDLTFEMFGFEQPEPLSYFFSMYVDPKNLFHCYSHCVNPKGGRPVKWERMANSSIFLVMRDSNGMAGNHS